MLAVLLLGAQALSADEALADPCTPPVANAIACENSKPGDPPSQWDVTGSGDPSIQGFATEISINAGETVHFKIKTPSSDYRLDIYRMGYYGGGGARRVDIVLPSASLPQSQPGCESEASTGLIDCGNWVESAAWTAPANAVSGIYFAKLVRNDTASDGSHIIFVVRDDVGHSDLLFQTSDTTWQAYNSYGGNSLYEGGPGTAPGRAYKVSYNRPLTVRGSTPEDGPFSAEYPMVRWLERNGYDVSYFTGVDADRRGSEILEHEAYLSVGHDEYWSGEQRANVEAAREAGVNLAFFSGNEVFWKTRWEDSIDSSETDHRTLVCYKETHANDKIDPEAEIWTGTWRDPRFSDESDGGRPENALTGTSFTVNSGSAAIEVPAADGKMRLWRETSIASLEPGQTATLADETLGYEWDEDPDNGSRPPGLIGLSTTTVEVPQRLVDYGSSYAPGTATHHLTLYRAPSKALVFGAGTVQWSWGLDEEHDWGGPSADPRMQQATVNLFADMGVQPDTLQGDLEPVTQATDTHPPTATISSPDDGADLESGTPVTISGIASDAVGETGGGQVAGVEISTDGGDTWHPADGREQWTYKWTPGETGEVEILARAIDDSGNLEDPGDQVTVEVVPHTCPCSIWDDSFTGEEDPDPLAVEVGIKFRSDNEGFITGLRFYKTPLNTGTHIGYLWSSDGTELAHATFTTETATGWQEVRLDNPVQVEADEIYVASYHAPNGHYAAILDYFALVGADRAPLHALVDAIDERNGVYNYGTAGGLFSGEPQTYRSANYLVDVVFEEEVPPDANPPQVSTRIPSDGATKVSPTTSVAAVFGEAMNPSSIGGGTFELRDSMGQVVPGTVAYSPTQRRATFSPSTQLDGSAGYTAMVKGGPSGVADLAGNHLVGDVSWSFTTAPPAPPMRNEGTGGPILVISQADNEFSRYYAEILRTEGLNEFTGVDISNVTPAVLDAHDVAILGEGDLSAAQVQMLESWVEAGGNLIAMRPDPQLAGLLGLSSAGGVLSDAYLKVDTGTGAGAGIVDQTIQFHGTADRYTASGAEAIGTLHPSAGGPATANPAVTLRDVGSNGGQAAAFTYDLAKSVVYTRQGNPDWAGEDRDGALPKRSDDLFFGAKPGNEQSDWVDLNKVDIPQADEQQRLLTNLIEKMNVDRKPLPRFWFLPRDEKAVVVMSGDDHGNGATVGRFEQYEENSPSGCVVAEWQCVRATSYIYPGTPITNGQAAALTAAGFEIGLHTTTGCADWPSQSALESFYSSQLTTFEVKFPSLPSPSTNRTHCIVWSDWANQPKVERENGIRLDANYYYWPAAWVQNRPGMFTGSGMPMRFADLDGSMIDVYQAASQMTDESNQAYPFTIDTLLDRALGPQGYYGVFTANIHTDVVASAESDAIVESAQARGVPIISAQQLLSWLDGRNQSSFGSLEWAGNALSFTISPGEGANGLRAMLPIESRAGELDEIVRDGNPVATTTREIKGIEYAFFDATAGGYTAIYGPQTTAAPNLTATVPASPANQNSPQVFGTAPAGSTVRLYAGADCEGSPIATASAAQLGNGVAVFAPDDSSTTFRASASLEATGISACSAPLTYLEDSTAPQSAIDSAPGVLVPSAQAQFGFSGTDSGAGLGSFECRLDGGDWTVCESSQEYVALGDGGHGFEVRAIDKAGNVDASPAIHSWSIDTTAPAPVVDSLTEQLLGVGGSSELTWHANENGAFSLKVGGSDCSEGAEIATGSYSSQPAPHSTTIDVADLPEGQSTLRLCLADAAANRGSVTLAIAKDTTEPETEIDSGPAALVNLADASFAFKGLPGTGSAMAGLQCRLDGGEWTPCESPQDYQSLAEGSHSFQVRAVDQAANVDSTPAVGGWSVDTIAPVVSVDSGPSGLTNNHTPTFGFGSEPGATFECSIDAGTPAFGPCSGAGSHTPSSPLADGPYTFRVRASDAADNQATQTRDFQVDTAVPAAPQLNATTPASPANDNTPLITGSAPSGTTIRLYASAECSGAPVTTVPVSGLEAGVEVTVADNSTTSFSATATTPAENTSACSDPLAYVEDSAAPSTQITDKPASLVKVTTASFSFTGNDPGGSGIASFQCRIDSDAPEAWETCTSAKQYSGLGEGSHTFEVRSIDNAGNTDESPAIHTWIIDLTPPVVSVDSGPSGLSNDSTPTFGFHAEESEIDFECSIDTGTPSFGPCSDAGSHTPASPLADGPRIFRVRATDQAANQAVATRGFTVDATEPNTQITAEPAALVKVSTASFSFVGNDASGSGVASFECRLDAGAWEACSSPNQYSDLGEGSHTFQARAIDNAGNADSTPATYSWSVDTKAPETAIDSAPPAISNSADASFVSHGEDPGGSGVASLQCRRDSDQEEDWEPCATTRKYTLLAEGAHKFEVRAIDNAGNVDASPATHSWSIDTKAPNTQIADKPASLVNVATASFSFTGEDPGGLGVASFQCRIDSEAPGAWEACTSAKQYSGLAEGDHRFEVRAIDQAGNVDGTPAVYSWQIDLTAPLVTIDSLSDALLKADESTDVSWHASENGNFQLRVGGADCDTGTVVGSGAYGTSPAASLSSVSATQLQEGQNTLRLCLTDAAGNRGQASTTLSKDTQPAGTQITAKPALLVDSTAASFSFTGNDPGGSGVASFECRLDSNAPEAWVDCTSAKQYTDLGEGSHKFEVRAIDQAGNVDATPETHSWSVDTEAPQTQITDKPASLVKVTTASFSFTGNDPGGSGIASFQCRIDSDAPEAWEACTSAKQYADLSEGAHTFEARAIDEAGNVDSTPATYGWSVDLTPPVVSVDSGPSGLTNNHTPTFGFGSEPGATFECSIDAGTPAFGPCSGAGSHTPSSPLADGPRIFRVRATDQAANQAVATRGFTVDATEPNTQITAEPAALVKVSTASFSFVGNDASGSGVASFECRLDAGAWEACSSPNQYSDLGEGSHTFQARAIDNAGNADSTPATYSWSVDTKAPETAIDSAPPAISNSADASFVSHGEDPGGSGVASLQCRRDSDQEEDWEPCATTRKYTLLAEGAHKFEVRAIDNAGNVDASPATHSWSIDTKAPNTQIADKPASLVNVATASFSFTGEDPGGLGVASFQCRIDSEAPGAWEACTSAKQYSGLAEGDHRFEVRAIDQAGNVDGTPAVYGWTVDTEGPETEITDKPAALVKVAAASFSFTGDDPGGSGVQSFQCRLDSEAPGAWESCSSSKQYSGLADGSHAFDVRAIDQAGNADATAAIHAWTVDTEAPETEITDKPASLVKVATASFVFAGDDPDGSGVASFECRLDSGASEAWEPCGLSRQYADLGEGNHEFEVRSIDQAGNADATPAIHEWTVDTEAPQTQITDKPASLVAVTTASFSFTGNDPGGSGVASFECRLDSSAPGSWEACTSAKQYSGLGEGSHTFEVRSIDQAGNVDETPEAYSWSADSKESETEITDKPASLVKVTTASFSFTGNDPGGSGIASFQCRIDSDAPEAWEACTSAKQYADLSEGAHTFEARAIDEAGNVDSTPATYGWSVDLTPPVVSVDSGPSGLTNNHTPTFGFGSEPGATFECSIDAGTPAFGPCSGAGSHTPSSPLADGPYTFRVRASDAADNQATQTRDFQVDTAVPAAPQLNATTPASPANDNTPLITGSAPSGTTIRLYASAECSGAPVTTVPVSGLEAGVEVTVADNSTTSFSATATTPAENTSACSDPLAYVEDSAAPSTQITDKPASLVKVTTASFSFTGNDPGGSGIASFQCRIDSDAPEAWETCTSAKQYSGLGEGSHTFEVRSIDNAGNTDESPAIHTWIIDLTPPVVSVDSGPSGLSNDSTPTFGFHAEESEIDFECSIDTGTPSFGPCSDAGSHTPASPLADGPRIFRVRATDQAANQAVATRGFTVDATEPNTQITAEPAALVKVSTASFSFVGNDASGSGVASFECRLDSDAPEAWETCTSAKQYSDLGEGSHTFQARAIDNAGNADSTPATYSWSVDTKAPETAIADKPAALVNVATASLSFTGEDPGGSGVASFECRIDSEAPGAWEACSSAKPYSDLVEGSHTFEVRAIDAAGNGDATPAIHEWTVDTKGPQTEITDKPAALVMLATASFSFTGDDPGGSGIDSFECRLDSDAPEAWEACSSPNQYSDLGEGSHTFEVRAIDNAGNADSTPATYSWSVDLTPPLVSVTSGPSGLTNNHTPTFGFGSEPGATFECSIDTGTPAFAPCSDAGSHTPASPLADGPRTFRVRATDQAGNQAVATRSFEVDTAAPQAPELTATVPASPANENSPKVVGSAPTGTTVRLYRDENCSAGLIATVSASEFETGIEVTVADNSTTSFSATSTTPANNTSGCSEPLLYVEDSAVPSTQIIAKPALLGNLSTASFSFTGNDPGGSGIASFQCRLDSDAPEAWETCTSAKQYSDLGEGSHTFQARAIDNAGNADSTPATYSWSVDLTPPVVSVDSGPSGLSNDSTPTFGFGSEPGASFECSIDTGTASFGPCSDAGSHTPASPLSDGPYIFRVRATDQAGNQAVATRGFQLDTAAPQAPQLTATVPASPANANSPKVVGSAPAGTTVRLYQGAGCSADPIGTVSVSALEAGIEVTVADNSTTSFSATATTPAENTSACSDPLAYVEDSAAPSTQITDKPASLVAVTTASFSFTGNDPGGSGVASFECRLDSSAPGSWETCTSAKQYSGLGEGSHAFEVRAIDQAGNVDETPEAYSWSADSKGPETEITDKPASLVKVTTASFSFTGNDPGGSGIASFQCRIDSDAPEAWETCTSAKQYSGLGEGSHTFEVRSIDNAGNTDESPAIHTWIIDLTPPVVSVDSGPSGLTNNHTPTFGFGSEPGATFECSIDAGTPAFGPCSGAGSHTPSSPLADGPYTFRVRASDAADNQATQTRDFQVDTAVPAAPQLNATTPASPANDNTPLITGSAPSGTTIRLYASAECSGAPVTTVPVSGLEAGVEVTVADNSTTSFSATATTPAENTSACSDPLAYVEDSAAPSTQITDKPASLVKVTTASFSFTGNDPGGSGIASFQCRIDSDAPEAWETCTSAKQYSGLGEGSHTFEVRSIDNAGNTDESPAIHTWIIDLTPPVVSVDSGPSGLSNDSTPTFGFHAEESEIDFECSIDTGTPSFGPCSDAGSHTPASPLADGPRIFRVRATDQAANQAVATRGFTVDATEPNTQITAEPAALVKVSTASFSFVGNDASGSGVASFECRLDAGAWEACSSPNQYSDLGEGSHTFQARAIDNAGNADSTPATYSWSVDLTPPVVSVDSGPSGLSNDSTPTFGFGSEPGASFECSIDTGTASFGPCSDAGSHTPASPLSDGPYIFRVRATDQAGNQAVATRGFQLDTAAPQAPQLTATVPASPANANSPKVVGSAPAGTTVRLYQGAGCSADPIGTVSVSALEAGIEVTVADNSTTSFSATATTPAENTSACSDPLAYVEDSAAPSTQITDKPASLVAVTTASFSFTGNDPGGSGVASFECRLDSSAPGAWETCTSAKQYSGLGEGSHAFEVRAIDQAGNVDATPALYEWNTDTVAPQTEITANPLALFNSSAASFSFTGEDPGGSGVASFECRRDSSEPEGWTLCTSPRKDTSLAEGSHTFEVRAIDSAGNVDQTPASFTWSIDTKAPQAEITGNPAALVNSTTAIFVFTGEDTGGSGVASFECRRDSSGAWQSCSSPRTYTGLSVGTHSFEVRAIDEAGNTDSTPASYEWEIDANVPEAPQLSATVPASPSGDNTPLVVGSAPAGTTVRLYSDQDCEGSAIATRTAEELEAGIEVMVGDDSTTTFRATSTTLADNTSSCSEPLAYVEDSTAPQSQVTSSPAALVNDTAASFAFTGEDTGGSGVALFECRLDSSAPGAWGACTPVMQYADLIEDNHKFEVRAIDEAGNTDATPATYQWQIDLTPPAVLINGGPTGLTNNSTPDFSFSSEPSVTFQCSIDAGAPSFGACSSASSHAAANLLSDGPHTFRVRATDLAGNQATATRDFVTDTSAPDTQITTKPSTLASVSSASFSFTGDDGVASGVAAFQCRLDSTGPSAWEICTSPKAYVGLADGPHSFEVRAIDDAGNADDSPAAFQWAVDTSVPQEPLDPDASSPTPAEAGSARFLRVRRNAKKGTARLVFDLSGPGLLSLRAEAPDAALRGATGNARAAAKIKQLREQQKSIKPSDLQIVKARQAEIPVELTVFGKKLLHRDRILKLKVVIRFKSADGSSAIWKVPVTLKKDDPSVARRLRQPR